MSRRRSESSPRAPPDCRRLPLFPVFRISCHGHSSGGKVSMGCTRILFVCAGNICRSPLAEGILTDIAEKAGRLDEFDVDSAGTGGWHQGSPPDRRSVAVATRHGIDISGQRARRVTDRDFASFDLILAMDKDNLEYLRSRSPASSLGKIHLFDAYTRSGTRDVPDP